MAKKPWQHIRHYWVCDLKNEACGDDILDNNSSRPPPCPADCPYRKRLSAQKEGKS